MEAIIDENTSDALDPGTFAIETIVDLSLKGFSKNQPAYRLLGKRVPQIQESTTPRA